MIADHDHIFDAWRSFQTATGGLKRPKSEAEYLELLALMDELTSRHKCNEEPFASLFDIIATYMHEWELENEAELKNPEVAPHVMLAHLMEQHGVTQYQLDKEGIVNQANLSKILKGERGISKNLAKKLGKRFGVGIEMFL